MRRIRAAVVALGLALVLASPALAATEVTFWSAPNPPQEVFWRQMAERFNASQDEIRVTVRAMAESPSSEATILTALAGGTAPTGSENIFIGFGSQLFESGALVPLDTLPGWEELIKARNMEQSIEAWKFPDGHYYILPIYANAMLFGWRIDLLKELGYQEPPRTYSEVIEVGRRLRERDRSMFLLARPALAQNTWWERWFDFLLLYNAASDGQPFISGADITADEEAAIGVLQFYKELNDHQLLLTRTVTDPFATGLSIWQELGPWTFSDWAERFPELQYGVHFTLTPPPVPDHVPADQPVKTFADAKGLVIYAQSSPEEQQALFEFIRWVFSDPANDLEWLEVTGLPPVRDDLAANPVFQEFFEANPVLRPYAEALPYAVPPFTNSRFADIQTTLSDEGLLPVLAGRKSPETAWRDAKAAIQAILDR
ncbi:MULTISPECIES: extracellular solute-binding protein [Limnochorda]|uniref:extracellular solute-binding protein n=1 Tax=Limnochorda TaxID=1676651 RepID=UPI001791478E|nr:extracellular solute-binding protein [Limnochorda pilosa]MBO2486108.1 sugar ABC transporter substrate-binding protein [Bacillota bacterium]MBO2518365.1 sugar ABC transporter substrate-binding protein [Bacillota bacterium]NMA71252.1 extracellular solute-binding protein [Bacillota bacterium]